MACLANRAATQRASFRLRADGIGVAAEKGCSMLCAEWSHFSGEHPFAAACAETRHALVAAHFLAQLGSGAAIGRSQCVDSSSLHVAMAVPSIHHQPLSQLPLVRIMCLLATVSSCIVGHARRLVNMRFQVDTVCPSLAGFVAFQAANCYTLLHATKPCSSKPLLCWWSLPLKWHIIS